ncbi:YopX family protein [Hoylesella timonensis]|uniref:YopX family protein n=1 Tax=Hoylesella timonensis TaxID=386414 RepID=UPI00189AE9AA|nr:YopX family protein [Hoylesella timonensis]
MKREILFRGWNKKNKKWLYGYYCVNRGEHFIAPDEFVNPLASYEDYVVEADSVGQYTGLKDANGVKIFEGDIIVDETYPYIIQYHEEYSQFVAVPKPNVTIAFYQQWVNERGFVVIGNVHENKELIEKD